MRASRLLFLTFVLAALALGLAQDEPSPAEDDSAEPHETVAEVVQETFEDMKETITKSDHPIDDLQMKYGKHVKKMVTGGCLGFIVGKIVKHTALSVLKVAFFGGISFAVAIGMGWIGKDPYDVANQMWESSIDYTNKLEKMADLNRNGVLDLGDLKVLWRRVERVLLKGNLPTSFGAIVGTATGFFV